MPEFNRSDSKQCMLCCEYYGVEIVMSRILKTATASKIARKKINWSLVLDACADIIDSFGIHNCDPVIMLKYTMKCLKQYDVQTAADNYNSVSEQKQIRSTL